MSVGNLPARPLHLLNRNPDPTKAILNPVRVNLMNDCREIAKDHAQGCDVIRDDRQVDFNFNSHFQSPVMPNTTTVEAVGGGVHPHRSPANDSDREQAA